MEHVLPSKTAFRLHAAAGAEESTNIRPHVFSSLADESGMDTKTFRSQVTDSRPACLAASPAAAAASLFCIIGLLTCSMPAEAQLKPGFTSVKAAPFYAMGDGVSNDYAAFQRALNSSTAIYVPAGAYLINNTSGPLIANNFSQTLAFDPGATIVCTTPNQGCLGFEGGYNPHFSGIHITYATVPVDDCRVPNGMCSTLYFRGTTNATIDSTTIDNGWAIAFGFINNFYGTITNTTVNTSTRDGLFLQDNLNVQVSDLRVTNTGDDCLGFHDTSAGQGRHGATATRISCTGIRGGGLAIAGASNVTVTNFIVNGSSAPGVYVISDPSQLFLKPTNVIISNGVILNVGSIADTVPRNGTQHGIMIYGSPSNPLGSLTFQNLHISGTNGSGVLGGGFVDSVTLNNIAITNAGLDGPVSNASCVSITGQSIVSVNGLSTQNCYRAGFLSVANSAVSVKGLTVTNAWTKGYAEAGAKAVDLFANGSIQVDSTVIIDNQARPTGYVFSEWQNGFGAVTNLTSQIEYGNLQVVGGSPGISVAKATH
jgi:hypothetical protein